MEEIIPIAQNQIASRIIYIRGQYVNVILNDGTTSMSQDVILKRGQNIKKCPLVFTEQGASMFRRTISTIAL